MSDNIKDEQNKDLNKISISVDVFEHFKNIFSNNYHTFVVRKAERLASVLYVITGFMPSEEPVRGRLRVCALELITRSSNPSELGGSEAEQFQARCAEIVAILETAKYVGLISNMNAKMIGEEYGSLASFVRQHARHISERGHALDRGSVSAPKTISSSIRHSVKSLLKDPLGNKGSNRIGTNNSLKNRKELILSLFTKTDKISIKDAVSVIPGISEKTVQRELLDMVQQGELTKEGNRRWTTYRKVLL